MEKVKHYIEVFKDLSNNPEGLISALSGITELSNFEKNIVYTWLCPNYEQIFPSTFEYDRDIARIEKTGESVIVDGVINQSFTITFFNNS